MIDEQATFDKFGYYSNDWSEKSSKNIVVICNKCGKSRIIKKNQYRSLCRSCKHLGHILSEETKQKISEAHKGKTGLKGELNPMYGKHHSDESKEKNRLAHLGKNNYFYGKKHTDEFKKLMGKPKSQEQKLKQSQSLIKHHYIYDHSDLSKYTMLITRKQHGNIHKCLRESNIKIPHINEVL